MSTGTLSVCMIVKNEAVFLARCLESVRPVADQIVIVDTGSCDQTIDVARSFGAEIATTEWRNDFARARNISLDKATGDWILWLDADDVVPADSLPELNALKKEIPDRVIGLIVRNERPNNTGSEFVQARMFPNRPDIRFERPVHEQMMPSALRIGLKMEKRNIVIEHHGYADPQILKRKAQRNIELMLADFDPAHPDPITAVEIADSYQLMENWEEAKKWYGAVLAVTDAPSPAILSQAHLGLGNIFNRLGNYESAVSHLNEAILLAPWRTDALYVLAVSYDLQGAWNEAISCLRRIVSAEASPGQVGVDFRAARIKATLRLMRILTERKRMDEALTEARNAIGSYPDRPELFVMAGKVLLSGECLIEALQIFEKSIVLAAEGNIDAYIGLCIIYRTANRLATARQSLDAIKPLFEAFPRYWAFRRYFLDEQEVPAAFSDAELEREWNLIERDFFNRV